MAGKALTWAAIIVDTFVASYLKVSPVSPGQAAEVAADRKNITYSTVSTTIVHSGSRRDHGFHQSRGFRVSG